MGNSAKTKLTEAGAAKTFVFSDTGLILPQQSGSDDEQDGLFFDSEAQLPAHSSTPRLDPSPLGQERSSDAPVG